MSDYATWQAPSPFPAYLSSALQLSGRKPDDQSDLLTMAPVPGTNSRSRNVITAALADGATAVVTISRSGSIAETLTANRLAKEAGATTIEIPNSGKSPLLAYTDIVLNTLARETQFRTEAMTSRIAQLAIVDALIACLALATTTAQLQHSLVRSRCWRPNGCDGGDGLATSRLKFGLGRHQIYTLSCREVKAMLSKKVDVLV